MSRSLRAVRLASHPARSINQRLLWLISFVGLTACAGGPGRPSPQQYDLAPLPASSQLPFASVEVIASHWLNGHGMHYRYQSNGQRGQYTQSRWSASPADQLQLRLQRALPEKPSGICRLRLELDDLVQVFPVVGGKASQLRLEARATLLGREGVLARRTLMLEQPAGMDAEAGVAAAAPLLAELGQALDLWAKPHCK